MNKFFYKLVFYCLAIGGLGNSLAATESSPFLIQKNAEVENTPDDPDSIPQSCITGKLQTFFNETSALHRKEILDGEFLAAKGSQVLLHLRSDDVSKIAEASDGSTQFMIGSTSKQFFASALLKAIYENISVGESEVEKT